MNIDRMDSNGQRKALDIDADMHFAHFDLLVPVKSTVRIHMVGTPCASGVDYPQSGALVSSVSNPNCLMVFEHSMFKISFVLPLPKIIVNSVVWRETIGEYSPLAATHKRVKDSILDFNQRVFAFALFRIKIFFNKVPLVVSDVRWIICHNRVIFEILYKIIWKHLCIKLKINLLNNIIINILTYSQQSKIIIQNYF